jgi:hypothetical protein
LIARNKLETKKQKYEGAIVVLPMSNLNPIENAPNAYEFSYDTAALKDLQNVFSDVLSPILLHPNNQPLLNGGREYRTSINLPSHQFYLVNYGRTPLLWISSNNRKTHRIFKRFYQDIELAKHTAPLIKHDKDIVLYSSFFVVGNWLPNEIWHYDFEEGANGYTFIAPLFEMDPEHGDLLYLDNDNERQTYKYQYGKGAVFGDRFKHSTETYPKANKLRVMLTLEFGTDRMEYWPIIRRTVAGQSMYMHMPCGHVRGQCKCEVD